MAETLSKESYAFNTNSPHSNTSAWPAFLEPYIKQVKPNYLLVRKVALTYWYTLEQVAKALWQYPDVRVLVYVLCALSALPLTIFTLYVFATLFVAASVASLLGIFITAVGLTIGSLFLAPFIIGAIFLAIGVTGVYKLYNYWSPTPSSTLSQDKRTLS